VDFNLDQSIPVQRLLAIARELEPGDEVEVEYLRDDRTQTTMVEAEDLSDWGRVAMFGPGWDSEEFAERMRELAERTREMEFRFGPEFQEELQDRIRHGEMHFRGPDRDIRILRPPGGAPSVMIDGMHVGRDGLELAELNPGLGQYFGASVGVLVIDIDDDSALGLQAGDVILSVGDREAETPGRVYRILESYGNDEEIRFRVRRDGAEIDVMGRL
jgi:hypothetical protein